MRKIAQKLIDAYNAGRSCTVGNSSVEIVFCASDRQPRPSAMFRLYKHPIVEVDTNGHVLVSFAGWPTVTTRSRINDLCELLYGGRPVSQHRGSQRVTGHDDVSAAAGNWYRIYPPVG